MRLRKVADDSLRGGEGASRSRVWHSVLEIEKAPNDEHLADKVELESRLSADQIVGALILTN